MNAKLRLAAGVLALVVAAPLAAEITFYGREDFRGRSFTFTGSVPDLEGSRLDERASSVRVRGSAWLVCSEPWYRGDCVTLAPGDYPSLRAMGLDNRVTSAREVGWAGRRPDGRGIVLYEGRGFTGARLTLDGSTESLGGFNDRARSLIVYDGEWELCEHDRFRGACAVFPPGEHPDLGRLAGEASSARPLGGPIGEEPWGRGVRAVLYGQPNFRGRQLVITDNVVHDLATLGFDDRASSLRVERGYWLFCSEPNFGGRCRTFGPGDYATLPPELADRLSSGRRIHERYPYPREPDWHGR